MKQSVIIGSCWLLSFLLIGCSNSSPQQYAKHFCDCSSDFARAKIQLNAGTIDQATYQKIEAEQDACLGDDNPFEALQDSPDDWQNLKWSLSKHLTRNVVKSLKH